MIILNKIIFLVSSLLSLFIKYIKEINPRIDPVASLKLFRE